MTGHFVFTVFVPPTLLIVPAAVYPLGMTASGRPRTRGVLHLPELRRTRSIGCSGGHSPNSTSRPRSQHCGDFGRGERAFPGARIDAGGPMGPRCQIRAPTSAGSSPVGLPSDSRPVRRHRCLATVDSQTSRGRGSERLRMIQKPCEATRSRQAGTGQNGKWLPLPSPLASGYTAHPPQGEHLDITARPT